MSAICPTSTFTWSSFRPEVRAQGETAALAERLDRIRKAAADLSAKPGAQPVPADVVEAMTARHTAATRAYWSALSRCASSMVTGPANFPTRRNEKANRAADKRSNDLQAHMAAVLKRLNRIAWPHGAPGDAIRADDPDAVAKLEDKLAELKNRQDLMKKANAIIRKHKAQPSAVPDLAALGLGEKVAAKLLEPDFCGRLGFADFQLTNNRATIKATEARLATLKANLARPETETEINGVKIVQNVDAQRVQMLFPGKPAAPVIAALKSRGFRWSPSFGAWQRQLNNAGIHAAETIARQLAA